MSIKKKIPRKKSLECKEEQLSKLKPDIALFRDKFHQRQFCPYEQSQSSTLPFLLLAMKYVKLQQRKKAGKEEKHTMELN